MAQGIRFDFLKYRYIAAIFSLSFLAVSVGFYFYRLHTRGHGFTYSIDFTGGTQILFKFSSPVGSEKIKEIVEKAGWEGPLTREFSESEALVRVKEVATDAKGLGARLQEALQTALPGTQVSILQSETVGGGVGSELRWNATRAILFSLIAMLIYIAVTFWSFSFAIGAIIALFHDPLFMLGTFLFLDKEISIIFIAAILAVIGYSINDTIVVFAQIRKNIQKMHGVPLAEVVNLSLNQTLRRTTLTSFATALTVLSMYLLGGEALRDFSLALLIGIVIGTYSSIYVASPIMMMFYKEK
jgi:preprotein translocase subunit SecF